MTSTALDRRSFLRAAAATATVGTASSALLTFGANVADAKPGGGNNRGGPAENNGGYGPIAPVGERTTGEELLALPAGFSYTAFGRTGDLMTDGNPTPADHDGMAAFPGPTKDTVRLVRNHELSPGETPSATVPGQRPYDPGTNGGTTNLVYDTKTNELMSDAITLSGTTRNCAGGPTPWGSWLTCEETYDDGPGELHGYVFEVPADASGPVDPVPLRAMGRFYHEAVAVDPVTGIVYETEDRGTSGFYRFIPTTKGRLADGGRLQMLAIKDRDQFDTRTGQRVGKPLPVRWVDIENPDPGPGTDRLAVFNQGLEGGGAIFDRLEGAWYGDGSIYIVSTSGGDAGVGQIWEYRPTGSSGGQLILVFESPDSDVLEAPDNITVTPGGALILCEDGPSTDFLRGIDQRGRIFDFGFNALNGSEFAGACFSPDGSTMFVNIQSPGISLAIQGPFDRGVL